MAQPRAVHHQAVQLRSATRQGPVVQRHGNGEAFQLPANLSNFGGGGQPLPGAVRQKMESFFGTSFADVRVHVGPQASAIGALAFTQGSNLYFAQGQYNPNTPQGQQILGHELTHVVQQRAGRVRNPFASGVAVVQDRGMEAEADRMGLLATAHRPSSGSLQLLAATQFHSGTSPGTPVRRSAFGASRPTGPIQPYGRAVIQALPYVTVMDGGPEWHGEVVGEPNTQTYLVRVGGTTKQVTVRRDQVKLHSAFVPQDRIRRRHAAMARLFQTEENVCVAVCLNGGEFLIASNTGNLPELKIVEQGLSGEVEAREGNTRKNDRSTQRDIRKLNQSFTDGLLQSARYTNPINCSVGGMHAEMAVMEKLVSSVTAGRVHIAVSKRLCKLCQIAVDAWNQHSGGLTFVMDTSKQTGTHEGLYPCWRTPTFLKRNQDVWEAFVASLKRIGAPWSMLSKTALTFEQTLDLLPERLDFAIANPTSNKPSAFPPPLRFQVDATLDLYAEESDSETEDNAIHVNIRKWTKEQRADKHRQRNQEQKK
jgi:hypothetical protein